MEAAIVVGSFQERFYNHKLNEELNPDDASHNSCVIGTSHLFSGFSSKNLPPTGKMLISPKMCPKPIFMVSAKALVTSVPKSSHTENSAMPQSIKPLQTSLFPDDFEKLVHEVCDNTEIAEVKLKVGEFEVHLKRNVEAPKIAVPIVSPTTAPPIPSEPMVGSVPVTPTTPQQSSSVSNNHFKNVSSAKELKLAALESSGANAYVLVSSPTVGSFRNGRTVKGKRQSPSCKEGDLVKEGQTIGYLDQFGSELPVKSDVAGEVLKVLYRDGEAVGYGDPLVAVLPSFPGIDTFQG